MGHECDTPEVPYLRHAAWAITFFSKRQRPFPRRLLCRSGFAKIEIQKNGAGLSVYVAFLCAVDIVPFNTPRS